MDFKLFICIFLCMLHFSAGRKFSHENGPSPRSTVTSHTSVEKVFAQQGQNALVDCFKTRPQIKDPIFWWHDSSGRIVSRKRTSIVDNGQLLVRKAMPSDSGFYECQVNSPDGRNPKTYPHYLLVYRIPDHIQNTTFNYKTKDCRRQTTFRKAQSIWNQLCNTNRATCEYSVVGKCVTEGHGSKRNHTLTVVISSTLSHNYALNHPECKDYECTKAVVKQRLLKQQIRIDMLAQYESLSKSDHESGGIQFVFEQKLTSEQMRCDAGFRPNSQQMCIPCRPGTTSEVGAEKCVPCPRNSYNNRYGSGSCVPCPRDGVTERQGAWSSQACKYGDKARKSRAVNEVDDQFNYSGFPKLIAVGGSLSFMVVVVVALACCAGTKKPEKEIVKQPSAVTRKPSKKSDVGSIIDPKKAYSSYSMPASMASLSDVFYEDLETEQIGASHKRGSW